jgi:hypothetical protein
MGRGVADVRAAALYTLCLPLVVVGTVVVTNATIAALRGTSLDSGPAWLLVNNVAPPTAIGLGAALLLARIARRRQWYGAGWRGHFGRAGSAYLLALAIITLVGATRPSGFAIWAPPLLWPLLALVAFLATDAVLSMRSGRAPAV